MSDTNCQKCKGAGAYLEAAPGSDDPIPYPCDWCRCERCHGAIMPSAEGYTGRYICPKCMYVKAPND